MDEKIVREAVVRLLEEKGYRVTSTAAGQGVPKLSRLGLEMGGKKQTAVIKVSSGGRISFTRVASGSYRVLSDADLVIHAQPAPEDPTQVRVMVFERNAVIEAFEENHKALVAHKMAHIPSWVNPEYEGGWRQSGSGFKHKALSTDLVPIGPALMTVSGAQPDTASATPLPAPPTPLKLTLKEAKAGLAANYGVGPDDIDIIIRG
jgi:hypothetical protein